MTHSPADEAPINRNYKRRQRTRVSILAAADRVFRQKGVTATTVNDITDAADIAYGSFYNHFKSLDDVVAAAAASDLICTSCAAILRNRETMIGDIAYQDKIESRAWMIGNDTNHVHDGFADAMAVEQVAKARYNS